MKEMYLRGKYFGKFLDMCYEDKYYGRFGEITDMTYNDGSPLHTGDIVKLVDKDGSIRGHRIVAHNKNEYGIMGVFSSKFINGKSSDWSVELVNKYYNNNETKVGDITIVGNEQFLNIEGGNEMDFLTPSQIKAWKREPNLSVSLKIQPNGKTVVAECTHIADELRGNGVLAEKDWYKVRSDYSTDLSEDILYVRGEDKERDYIIFSYNFRTPEQAQHYVKIMNELIYEINNPKTNWSKVEVGTEVIWTEVHAPDGRLGSFHSYVPSLNKVIVICGNEIKAVDASEVELC